MNRDHSFIPLIDRSDFSELLKEGRFGRWWKQASDFHHFGFCCLDLEVDSIAQDCDRLIEAFELRLGQDLEDWEAGRSGSPRVQDAWRDEPAVRRIALAPEVLDLLRHLYGREPFPFQTLNFAVGSEQHFHSDAVHFHAEPAGFMCGVWIPLADVEADSGPLVYYPGSHRLPYRTAAGLGLTLEQVAAEPHPQHFFEPIWRQEVEALGFQPELFLPRRGQVLIWHANLLHGGSPVANRKARRWSQVVHFYFEGCLYTTPMMSFRPDQGGATFRAPVDIASGQTITLPMQRSAMDLPLRSEGKQPIASRPRSSKSSRPWFHRFRSPRQKSESPALQGHIELISPSLLTGWIYHPDFVLTDVRLICGSQLVASARIDGAREDVCRALGVRGSFGFQIEVPDGHPQPGPGEPLQVLAFPADGSVRFALTLPGPQAPLTDARLRSALDSRYRGLRGHFDGLSPDGDALVGWCFSAFFPQLSVWIHAEGLPSRRILCASGTDGDRLVINPEDSTFRLPLADWPEIAGRRVWVSFDEEGSLPLPPLNPLHVPARETIAQ